MKKALATAGLAGILLAGTVFNAEAQKAQKREYIPGNIHDVKYDYTTEKDFPKYKLEDECLFRNCYNFWVYTPKVDELDFNVSKIEDNITELDFGGEVNLLSKRYTPKIVARKIDVTELPIETTSYKKLRRRAKEIEDFGFSVDITDKDLKFKLPSITKNGTSYVVLEAKDNFQDEKMSLPLYLIPKIKGTKIRFINNPFIKEDGNLIQAIITCDENGGIYQPILNRIAYNDAVNMVNSSPQQNTSQNQTGMNGQNEMQNQTKSKRQNKKQKQSPSQSEIKRTSTNKNEIQKEWQGNTEETPYMKYLKEQEK